MEPGGNRLDALFAELALGEEPLDDRLGNTAAAPLLAGKVAYLIGDIFCFSDVVPDFPDASQFESATLVGMAERAAVPGTVSRCPDQEALRFAWWSYGTFFHGQFH
jgi:hypothetical protein